MTLFWRIIFADYFICVFHRYNGFLTFELIDGNKKLMFSVFPHLQSKSHVQQKYTQIELNTFITRNLFEMRFVVVLLVL